MVNQNTTESFNYANISPYFDAPIKLRGYQHGYLWTKDARDQVTRISRAIVDGKIFDHNSQSTLLLESQKNQFAQKPERQQFNGFKTMELIQQLSYLIEQTANRILVPAVLGVIAVQAIIESTVINESWIDNILPPDATASHEYNLLRLLIRFGLPMAMSLAILKKPVETISHLKAARYLHMSFGEIKNVVKADKVIDETFPQKN